MTPEQKFYQWFRKQLPFNADCCRVENTTMGGMPDVNICWEGNEIWVELKCFVSGRTLIRPAQNAWMHRRKAANGKIFLISQHSSAHNYVWAPPFTTQPHGKYLHVTSMPQAIIVDGKELITHLFSSLLK